MDRDKYPLALPEDTVLNGRYIIKDVLGQGGFGITYKAVDHRTGMLVAIKEYFPTQLVSRTGSITVSAFTGERAVDFDYGKKCFLGEAETISQFNGNPGIVRIHRYFEENGTAYYAMDYIDGSDLSEYIKKKGGKIGWKEAVALLMPIMEALSLVHSKEIIHRDIAPDNIRIDNNGKVYIIDFGAARYSLGDKSMSYDVILKHGYAPKEQYTRHGRQGVYTDIYALSATVYRCITGLLPPDSIDRIDVDALQKPSQLGIEIPEGIEETLIRGLALQPEDRFKSMNDFKQAFTDVIREEEEKEKKKNRYLIPIVVVPCCLAALAIGVLVLNCRRLMNYVAFSNASVGSTVFWGSYEQDNDTSNGTEDIEWIVLAREKDRILVISRYALDCQQYNTSYDSVTWETCTLRKWLNETFLNAAFSKSERAMITSVSVSADKNPGYSTSPGNSTTDQVFLLSIEEANKYFSSDSARQCQGTAYCYAQGAYKFVNGNCWWWLRSPGWDSHLAANVDFYDGSVDDHGHFAEDDYLAVRPALWINLGS